MEAAANDEDFAPTFESAHGVLWESVELFVPSKTYASIDASQVVFGSSQMGLPRGEEPVVMRGAYHCRIYRRGGPRGYSEAIALRYIERARVTFIENRAWLKWYHANLLPLLQKRRRAHFWVRQQATSKMLWQMVGQNSVVIDGKWNAYVNDKQMALLRRMASGNRKAILENE